MEKVELHTKILYGCSHRAKSHGPKAKKPRAKCHEPEPELKVKSQEPKAMDQRLKRPESQKEVYVI